MELLGIAQKVETGIIQSYLVIPSRLKNLHVKVGQESSRPVFYPALSLINSGLRNLLKQKYCTLFCK